MSSTTPAGEQVLEGSAKVDVEDRVDDGVECRVDVAQPDDPIHYAIVGGRGAAVAERKYDVHEEERQPTDDERAHDDDHSARGAALLRQRDALLLLDELVHLSAHSDVLRRAVLSP